MKEVQAKASWTFTIWRPPIVAGLAYNSPLNVMAAIGAHPASRFGPPGTVSGPQGYTVFSVRLVRGAHARALAS